MQVIVSFDGKNSQALALLQYIKTLDFISVSEKSELLTSEQKIAIDEGLQDVADGNTFEHYSVLKQTKEKYPHLFLK